MYDDLVQATIAVNNLPDTYVGEMVMVQTPNDGFKPYVVELDEDNTYTLTPVLSGHISSIVEYDNVENVPIQNINATSEILLYNLPDGNYSVMGNYRIHNTDPTHRMSARKILFFIETDSVNSSVKYITEVKGGRIKFYACNANEFTEDKYLFTSELTTQIDEYLDENLGKAIDNYVETHSTSQQDINDLFD